MKFINDNKEAFKQLGIVINDVNDAQKAFIENSDKVVDALVKQAKARVRARPNGNVRGARPAEASARALANRGSRPG